MAELTINQLIKIIIGVLVFAAVILGVYLFFKNNVFELFKMKESELILGLLK